MSSQVKRKRNRVPLSCTICRKRKVKCDKTRPHCQQCSKTGVAHLCHYMEQTWAEEAEKELSKESELKQLRERVKSLEETLSKVHSTSNNTPESNIPEEPKLLQQNKYDNDELDLTRQFDMLHLKNNGTVHLGATHWLAIMKGDPYLKLLWGHIFMVREKLTEWYTQKKKGRPGSVTAGHCPVTHQPTASRCPVSHATLDTKRAGRCPVDHTAMREVEYSSCNDKAEEAKCPVGHSTAQEARCPVSHSTTPESKCPVIHTAVAESKCPVNHAGVTEAKCPVKHSSPVLSSNGSRPSIHQTTPLPSFQNLTSKCPVFQDTTPPPPQPPRSSSGGHNNSGSNFVSQDQAITRLCQLLPPKRIVALLLDKFFKFIYPVIPILDEQSFKSQVNQIIQTKDDSITLKLTKPSDCCTLGILMVILRITWLSLPTNACSIDLGTQCATFFVPHVTTSTVTQAKEESLLLNYETPSEAVDLVRKYMIKFDEISSFSNSNVNLTTVQFAIFYKMYLMCCPDSSNDTQPNSFTSTGQDNETHQVLLSSIVQMAFSCGLHRDPDNFPQLNSVTSNGKLNKEAMANTERLKHTWRKTWYFIVSLDVQQSLSLGTPRLLRNLNDFSDTKLPCASKIDYVRDIKELIIVKNFTLFFQIDLCVISVLNHILNVSMAKTVRKFELDSLIEILKELCYGEGNINEVLNKLVNKGLLFTTEGTLDQSSDEVYTLLTLDQILSPPPVENDKDKKLNLPHEMTTRALFFSKHITLRMLLYLLNYILFTHYEPKGSEDSGTRAVAKNYAQEALNFAMDGYRNCILFFNNTRTTSAGNASIFNYMELLLTPVCLDVSHRALQFMVCLILRAKCGPLTGMSESPIISSNNNNISSSSEDENEADNSKSKRESSAELNEDISRDISLDVGEELADILIARMVLFHKLTKQISDKYKYATRMTKSTGFFITLLKKPSHKLSGKHLAKVHKGLPKIQRPNISNMTGFFRNVPSLVLSASGDQLRRCPVYQDAIGFLPSKVAGGSYLSALSNQNTLSPQQLPPIRAYQPITYTSSDIRRTSDVRESDSKRRKLSAVNSEMEPPIEANVKSESRNSWSPFPSLQSVSSPSATPIPQSLVNESLPPLEKVTGPFSPVSTSNNIAIQQSSALNFHSPAAISEASSSVNYTPDFEDFLMQNSNLNGLMINPSSIVEAVGFDNYGTQGNTGSIDINADFLPIDNTGIDGLPELSTGNDNDFPLWD